MSARLGAGPPAAMGTERTLGCFASHSVPLHGADGGGPVGRQARRVAPGLRRKGIVRTTPALIGDEARAGRRPPCAQAAVDALENRRDSLPGGMPAPREEGRAKRASEKMALAKVEGGNRGGERYNARTRCSVRGVWSPRATPPAPHPNHFAPDWSGRPSPSIELHAQEGSTSAEPSPRPTLPPGGLPRTVHANCLISPPCRIWVQPSGCVPIALCAIRAGPRVPPATAGWRSFPRRGLCAPASHVFFIPPPLITARAEEAPLRRPCFARGRHARFGAGGGGPDVGRETHSQSIVPPPPRPRLLGGWCGRGRKDGETCRWPPWRTTTTTTPHRGMARRLGCAAGVCPTRPLPRAARLYLSPCLTRGGGAGPRCSLPNTSGPEMAFDGRDGK